MEEDELPFGYTHRPEKRSHEQMEEEGSASPEWRYDPFPDNHQAAPPYHSGLSLHNNFAAHGLGQDAAYDNHEGPHSRYQSFQQPRRAPSFASALRAARPPIGRASSSTATQSHTAGFHLPRIENMASSTSGRFPGDGFDYRRPAGSSGQQDVGSVDLTGEEEEDDVAVDLSRDGDGDDGDDDDDIIDLTADDSGYGASQEGNNGRQRNGNAEQQDSNRARTNGGPRLPRGMDIIIDLDNGEEEWRVVTPVPEPSSPDIEFISSRTIHPRRLPPPPNPPGNNSDGDEVEFLRENALPEAEIRRRRNRELDNVLDLFGTLNGRFTHLRAQVDRFNAQINRTAGRFQEPIAPNRNAARGHTHIRAFVAPVMDFDAIGFELGPRPREAPAPPPTYEAPPKAPEGFTRSPEEEGALICPNCEEELCVGDDEIKRQVWIVKGCGHVYCGECTTNRAAKRSAKGKERPVNTNPFKTCVVDGCDKNVSNKKSMIQVFL